MKMINRTDEEAIEEDHNVSKRSFSELARTYLTLFSDYTTAHGLGRLAAQSSIFGRLIWLIFLMAGYCGLAIHLYFLFDRYNSSPVLTTISSTVPFVFPDVYICPADSVTLSRMIRPMRMEVMSNLRSSKCELSRKAQGYKFNASQENSLRGLVNISVQIAESIEQSLMFDIDGISVNYSECRVTRTGEEYVGNVSWLPIRSKANYIIPLPATKNLSHPKDEGVVIKQCLPWKEAAIRLRNSSSWECVYVASRLIENFNFSNYDAKCRTPLSFSWVSKCGEIWAETYLPYKLAPIGCFEVNQTGMEFGGFCATQNISEQMDHETCADCCNTQNFTYIALHNRSCFCTNKLGLNMQSGNCTDKCRKKEQICGSESAATVLKIERNKDYIHEPEGTWLSKLLEGPYCFYDSEVGLGVGYCQIPYCSPSPQFDCVLSSSHSENQNEMLSLYSGRRNTTKNINECVNWNQILNKTVHPKIEIPEGSKRLNEGAFARLESTDFNMSSTPPDHNYCRAVATDCLYLSNEEQQVWFNSTEIRFINRKHDETCEKMESEVPGCYFWDADGILRHQSCEIPQCNLQHPSIRGVIRDVVGSDLLARQFGSSLRIGLVECQFGGKTCTDQDFISFVHPELGICHKFNKENFTQNVAESLQAQMQLSIKYFTDSTDSRGRGLKTRYFLSHILHSNPTMHGDSGAALKVLAVPKGDFPWSAESIDVARGQRMEINLRSDKIIRYPVPKRPCKNSGSPEIYRIALWKPIQEIHEDIRVLNGDKCLSHLEAMSQQYSIEDSNVVGFVLAQSNWHRKIVALRDWLLCVAERNVSDTYLEFNGSGRETCINNYIIEKFLMNCKCLPSFLPVPVQLSQHITCFNSSNEGELFSKEKCYLDQLAQLSEYKVQAYNVCEQPCETLKYTTHLNSYPWPILTRHRSLEFLTYLAKKFGYWKKSMSHFPGRYSVYRTYLIAKNISESKDDSISPEELQRFDTELSALEKKLAWITVKAESSFGQEIHEELAYPPKNLLADIGGAIGLWCGISILTLFELIELIAKLCVGVKRIKKM